MLLSTQRKGFSGPCGMARLQLDHAIGGDMPAPYSQDLRQRVIGFMALGGSARAAAARFDVSVSSTTRRAQRWRAEGHARPRAMGGDRRCRLREHSAKVLQLV